MHLSYFVSRSTGWRRAPSRVATASARKGFALSAMLLFAALAFGTQAAQGQELGLYEAQVPLTDRTENGRLLAFQEAMRQVLIRVTGRPAAGSEPALASLVGDARRLVQSYRVLSDGNLYVGFDGRELERRIVAADPQGLRELVLTINGIGNLQAYAAATALLEGQRLVRGLAVETLTGDAVTYRLRVHGGTEELKRALALDTRLVAQGDPIEVAPPGAAASALNYRWIVK